MKKVLSRVMRPVHALLAVALTLMVVMPMVNDATASAAQVTSRSIEMSDSTPSGTSVSYNVTFTPGTSTTVGGIVVDICDNDPIIGDTSCTFPTGFDWGGATPTLAAGYTGMGTGWTAAGVQGGAGSGKSQVLELSNATPQSLSTGTPASFTITSVVNPSTANHSFYARILTFDTSAHMTAQYTVTTTTRASSFLNQIDYGGVAMSTANTIAITAKVMESLSFCVYHSTCGDSPAISLGHGTNTILDNTAVDTNTDIFSISTNAQSGANIRMKGDTLKSGSNSLLAAGSTPVTINNGDTSHQFGMYVSTPGTGITKAATYNGGTGTQYGFNTANTTSTYGDSIATLAAPVNSSASTMTFGATAANTTPAGIYTTSLALIATGTF